MDWICLVWFGLDLFGLVWFGFVWLDLFGYVHLGVEYEDLHVVQMRPML